MGAGAITVLAGARIVEMTDTPMIDAARGLVAGVSLTLWAFAPWLVPVLVATGWWRHRTHAVRLTYEPSLGGMVFPLGMYAVAASSLLGHPLPATLSAIAILCWLVLAWRTILDRRGHR